MTKEIVVSGLKKAIDEACCGHRVHDVLEAMVSLLQSICNKQDDPKAAAEGLAEEIKDL